jgi:hypothetical protein
MSNKKKKKKNFFVAGCHGTHLPVISSFRRLRQEDHEFQSSLGYIARLCLKKLIIK